jgi:hypothetical protein
MNRLRTMQSQSLNTFPVADGRILVVTTEIEQDELKITVFDEERFGNNAPLLSGAFTASSPSAPLTRSERIFRTSLADALLDGLEISKTRHDDVNVFRLSIAPTTWLAQLSSETPPADATLICLVRDYEEKIIPEAWEPS